MTYTQTQPDLQTGYIARRKVKTFHVADLENPESGESVCGLTLADLINAGWARGLLRRGLELCRTCESGVDLTPPAPPEPPDPPEVQSLPEFLASESKDDLYARAVELDVDGRSSMNKAELIEALLEALKTEEEE